MSVENREALEELLESKVYVKEGGITFKSPKDYLGRFVDLVDPFAKKFRVSTSHSSINANEEDNSKNIAYGRVVVEAVLRDEYTQLGHDTTVGIIYALDTQKPILKGYTGQVAHACTNLCIFSADNIYEASLLTSTEPVYKKLEEYVNGVDEKMVGWRQAVERLKETTYAKEQVHEKLGFILQHGLKNNFTQGLTFAAKELFNSKSVYSVEEDGSSSAWNVLSACTQYVTDKSGILERPNLTLFAGSMFKPELEGISLN